MSKKTDYSRFLALAEKWRVEAENIGNMEDWLSQIIRDNLVSCADELDAKIAPEKKNLSMSLSRGTYDFIQRHRGRKVTE